MGHAQQIAQAENRRLQAEVRAQREQRVDALAAAEEERSKLLARFAAVEEDAEREQIGLWARLAAAEEARGALEARLVPAAAAGWERVSTATSLGRWPSRPSAASRLHARPQARHSATSVRTTRLHQHAAKC